MKEIRLSASTIKTFLNCSYLFNVQYHQHVPSSLHPSLPLGTLVHLAAECLLKNNKRKELARKIQSAQSISIAPSLVRLINQTLNKYNLNEFANYQNIENWILVALKEDFFAEGALDIKTEFQFRVKIDDYFVTGTIDKIQFYEDRLVLRDFKSSKQKFTGDDKTSNVQAMLYLSIARMLFPGYKHYDFEFIFLRFPRAPIQIHSYSEPQLLGFMEWVKYLLPLMYNQDEHAAESNFAFDDVKKKWLCYAGQWKCPYLSPFDYYWITNKKGEFIYSCMKEPKKKRGQIVEKRRHLGCPRHISSQEKSQLNSFFD